MKKLIAVASLLALAGCASGGSSSSTTSRMTANLIRPEVLIRQTSGVPPAARHITGGLPVKYAVRVGNKAAEPITLRQITVMSIGDGAYTVSPTSRPFNVRVEPDGFKDVEFWASAFVPTATTVGANGPVTLRLNLIFDSPVGKFEEILITQVNERTGIGDTEPH